MTKFFDAHITGPRGGWVYGGIQKYNEHDLVEAVSRARINNGTFVSEDKIREELWAHFCAREPERCGGLPAAVSGSVATQEPRVIGPKVYGPWMWNFLALSAVHFDKTFFVALCNRLLSMIECPDCLSEWRSILEDDPLDSIGNGTQASGWVLRQHNRVNAKLGKPQWSLSQFFGNYGSPKS